MDATKQMLTTKQLAAKLGVSENTVRSMARRGAPCYRASKDGEMRWDEDEARQWMKANAEASASHPPRRAGAIAS